MILSLFYGRFIQTNHCNDGRLFGLWALAFIELMAEVIALLTIVPV